MAQEENFNIEEAKETAAKAMNATTQSSCQYFTTDEIYKLQPALVTFLCRARAIANTSFIITSGFRTKEQNDAVGGTPNSSHLYGYAVDLLCTDSFKRDKIVRGLYATGTPCFVEIAGSHIHVDLLDDYHELGQTMWSNDD